MIAGEDARQPFQARIESLYVARGCRYVKISQAERDTLWNILWVCGNLQQDIGAMDTLTPEERSERMSRVRGKDRCLCGAGVRNRLYP